MDYRELAVELMDTIVLMQRRHLERKISALTEGEMATLGYLDRSGDGRTVGELSQALQIGAPRVTAIVNSLVKRASSRSVTAHATDAKFTSTLRRRARTTAGSAMRTQSRTSSIPCRRSARRTPWNMSASSSALPRSRPRATAAVAEFFIYVDISYCEVKLKGRNL